MYWNIYFKHQKIILFFALIIHIYICVSIYIHIYMYIYEINRKIVYLGMAFFLFIQCGVHWSTSIIYVRYVSLPDWGRFWLFLQIYFLAYFLSPLKLGLPNILILFHTSLTLCLNFFYLFSLFYPYWIISIYLCSLILSIVISILQICPSTEFLISDIVYSGNFNLVHLYVFYFTDFLSFIHYGYVFL